MADTHSRMLVTAGNTFTPIDAVRGITNVFTGRTGARIAAEATLNGYDVELLTSQPNVVEDTVVDYAHLTLTTYRTFDDLAVQMEDRVRNGGFHVIVHSAAVSDYDCAAIYELAAGAKIAEDGTTTPTNRLFNPVDSSKKVASRHSELWLRLIPTVKLVDQVRRPWGFSGLLVKFKLEVGISEEELVRRAKSALHQSKADLVVANSLESMDSRAVFVTADAVESIDRSRLPSRLIDFINNARESATIS